MKIRNYELARKEIIFWMICGIAVFAFILFVSLATNVSVEDVNIMPQDFFSNITNACINISSFFLAAIFAIYTILDTRDNTIPGELLTAVIAPIAAIITGLFALICSDFATTVKLAIPLIGLSLMLTIQTLAFIFFLIEVLIQQKTPKRHNLPKS